MYIRITLAAVGKKSTIETDNTITLKFNNTDDVIEFMAYDYNDNYAENYVIVDTYGESWSW